jgi:hypothetical protein
LERVRIETQKIVIEKKAIIVKITAGIKKKRGISPETCGY